MSVVAALTTTAANAIPHSTPVGGRRWDRLRQAKAVASPNRANHTSGSAAQTRYLHTHTHTHTTRQQNRTGVGWVGAFVRSFRAGSQHRLGFCGQLVVHTRAWCAQRPHNGIL